jgi:predicted DNA-binding WGR domain protein
MRAFLSLAFKSLFIAAMVLGGIAVAAPERVGLNADYQLSGPYAYKNLSVFLVHCAAYGKPGNQSGIQAKRFISLAEALEKGAVTIHETGDVNQLAASNHSDKEFVYIQSGDIVKGGRQDRTLSQDIILAPNSKKIPLDSFCVEQGRWGKRGTERSDRFSSSAKGLSSKELKLAAKKAKSQGAVWKAVEEEQEKLGRSIGKSVRSDASNTSLQLTLEDKDVEGKKQQYLEALLPVCRDKNDVIGIAFTINGQFNTADIYGDPALFQKLWPKLVEAAAYESLSLYDAKNAAATIGIIDIKSHILDAFNSPKQAQPSGRITKRTAGETRDNYAFETKDEQDQLIHVNIIKK